MRKLEHSAAIAATPPRSPDRSFARARWWLAAGAITLLALALRLWAIRQSLPYVNHPDEPNPVEYIVGMLKTGDLNPHAFQKPSLYVYLLLAVAAVQYRWGLATGTFPALDHMTVTTHLYTTVPQFFIGGRVLTATLGSLTVLAVFALGRRLWSNGAGVMAALVLAVSSFHVRHSQYVTTDVTSALLVLCAFAAAVWLAHTGHRRAYVLAGLCAGLAASTKYNAGVAAIMVIVAHVLHWRGASVRRLPMLVAAGAAAVGGFVLGTPFALLDWRTFWQGLTGQAGDYSAGQHGDFVGAWNWRGYADFFWNDGLHQSGCLLACVGLVALARRRPAVATVWLGFAVPYLLLHMAQASHFTRNMAPLVVLAALLAGIGVAALGEWLLRWPMAVRVIALAAVVLLALLPAASDTARQLGRAARGDTRVQMTDWVAAHVPPGERIAGELLPLPGPEESRWTAVDSLPQHDMAWYRRQGYAYLVASSDAWRQWDEPVPYRAWAGQAPTATFGGAGSQDMLGPRLLLFATGLAPADVPAPLSNAAQFGGTRLLGTALGQPLDGTPELGVNKADSFAPGAVVGIRTFWQVQQPFAEDFFIYVHVLDAHGTTVAQRDTPPWQGRFPTSIWQPGSLVVDVNDVALPAGLPPGEYMLEIGMFDPQTSARPPLLVDGQPPAGGVLHAATIRVK